VPFLLWRLRHFDTEGSRRGSPYPWAGELRAVQIAKPNAFYARPEHIADYAQGIFAELARKDRVQCDRTALDRARG
jgi:fido (protein-threonine AMPylation protein)